VQEKVLAGLLAKRFCLRKVEPTPNSAAFFRNCFREMLIRSCLEAVIFLNGIAI
jgi:hypothetical protein